MATRVVSRNQTHYGKIQRGNSLTIPVTIMQPDNTPIDLTDLEVAFTVKKTQYDFDRHDTHAYIRKDLVPQEPEQGRFLIELTSHDTDFEPGQFYFDIEIIAPESGMVHRICMLEFDLVGGPTNRTVNTGIGQLPIGNEITVVQLSEGAPIVIIAPMMALSPGLYAPIAELYNMVESQATQIESLQAQVATLQELLNG